MGSFSKMAIFLFCSIGLFAIVFGLTPGEFFKASYSPSIGIEKEIAEYFDLANVTLFSNYGSDNMTYEYSSYHHHHSGNPQFGEGLPENQFLEVWWAYELGVSTFEFRHIEHFWWGERLIDNLRFEMPDKQRFWHLRAAELELVYDDDINGSAFETWCNHISVSAIISFNQTKYSNITHAFEGGELEYVLSYEPNWNATSTSAFSVLARLLTFQNPDLGIEGDAGTIFNYVVAAPFWIMTAILIVLVVQSIVPFIRGIDA